MISGSDVLAETADRQSASARPTETTRTAVYWAFTLSGIAVLLIAFVILPGNGHDAFAYWGLPHGQSLYGDTGSATGLGVFRYSPTFALAVQPFSLLSWDLFRLAGTVASLIALAFLCRQWALAAICLPPVMLELYMGNIDLVLAAAIVLALRWPMMWSFVLLTKVTPGVGLLYLAGARRWRRLVVAVGATCGLISATALISGPGLWSEWTASLADWQGGALGQSTVPLLPRLVLAGLLAFWGGRRTQLWTVPLAATLALPVLWNHGYVLLLGVLPLVRQQVSKSSGALELVAPVPDAMSPA